MTRGFESGVSRFPSLRVGLVLLIGLVPLACGSSDDDDDSSQGGAGPVGGSTAATGGASTHDESGGAPASGGAIASDGGSGAVAEPEARVATACSNWHANGLVRGCTAVFADGYVAACEAELLTAAEPCPNEVSALLDCGTMLSVTEYACDEEDDITFAAGICSAEVAALEACAP